jgi:2,3-bisphosphoglycerate-dependent phosphoglycerate mutase
LKNSDTRLLLIRHGASIHATHGIIATKSSCPGLTDEGFRQVHLLAQRLHTTAEFSSCQTILTSPALRARQTANVLAHTLEIHPVIVDDDLTEIHPGEAEGLLWETYRARYGEFDLVTNPSRPFSPGGENWTQFITRVHSTLHRLAETYQGQTVLVATHAGFIVASMLVLFAIPRPGAEARLEPIHTSLTEWQIANHVWILGRYNDACHLVPRDAAVNY